MAQAISGRPVFITNRDQAPKVVLISTEQYRALVSREERALERMTQEYDALLEGMQSDAAGDAVDGLFSASSEDFGRAAVEAKRPKS